MRWGMKEKKMLHLNIQLKNGKCFLVFTFSNVSIPPHRQPTPTPPDPSFPLTLPPSQPLQSHISVVKIKQKRFVNFSEWKKNFESFPWKKENFYCRLHSSLSKHSEAIKTPVTLFWHMIATTTTIISHVALPTTPFSHTIKYFFLSLNIFKTRT